MPSLKAAPASQVHDQLECTPFHLSLYALANDTKKEVKVIIDQRLTEYLKLQIKALDANVSTVIDWSALWKIWESFGRDE